MRASHEADGKATAGGDRFVSREGIVQSGGAPDSGVQEGATQSRQNKLSRVM